MYILLLNIKPLRVDKLFRTLLTHPSSVVLSQISFNSAANPKAPKLKENCLNCNEAFKRNMEEYKSLLFKV